MLCHLLNGEKYSEPSDAFIRLLRSCSSNALISPLFQEDMKKVAFEEMNIAQWLYVLLKDDVDEIQIAHAAHLTKQRGAKTDYIDAVRLATELRNGTITQVFHADNAFFDLRQVVKSHQDVTQELVRDKNRYKSFLRSKVSLLVVRQFMIKLKCETPLRKNTKNSLLQIILSKFGRSQ